MELSRREMIAGAVAAAAGLTRGRAEAVAGRMPMRTLGRTGARVSLIGFGSAPLGHSFQSQEVFDRMLGEALDLGINYVDTATIYDVSQERLGPIVKRNRKRIFLTTKTRGTTKAGALKTIEESLRLLQTDHVDLVHMHNVGDLDVNRLTDDDSALRGIQEAQRRGWARFVGATSHMNVPRLLPVLATGAIDVIMVPINFVYRQTYDFEGKVLPIARKHRIGIIAMKVLGGVPNWQYRTPTPCLMPADRVELAIRYALSVPDVATAVIGLNFPEQLRQAAAAARAFKPLNERERVEVVEEGARLAKAWGTHLGPVQ
ncbi:MAG: aldo/keto reductase [Chthonomonadales bacterium]|nr:aldo/keto reductase [Chthonomonadales bacterium]